MRSNKNWSFNVIESDKMPGCNGLQDEYTKPLYGRKTSPQTSSGDAVSRNQSETNIQPKPVQPEPKVDVEKTKSATEIQKKVEEPVANQATTSTKVPTVGNGLDCNIRNSYGRRNNFDVTKTFQGNQWIFDKPKNYPTKTTTRFRRKQQVNENIAEILSYQGLYDTFTPKENKPLNEPNSSMEDRLNSCEHDYQDMLLKMQLNEFNKNPMVRCNPDHVKKNQPRSVHTLPQASNPQNGTQKMPLNTNNRNDAGLSSQIGSQVSVRSDRSKTAKQSRQGSQTSLKVAEDVKKAEDGNSTKEIIDDKAAGEAVVAQEENVRNDATDSKSGESSAK